MKSAETLELLLVALASFSLVIGGIGIMNIMLASVSQRTREIGIRMAVGASPSAIRLQFLGEAVLLTTLSGGVGVAISILAAAPMGRTLGWSLAMSMRVDLLAFLFAMVVGVFFGMYPAMRASNQSPS